MIVPIEFIRPLIHIDSKVTALDIQMTPGTPVHTVQQHLQHILPDDLQIRNQDEQQASLLQAIHIERLFLWVTFSLIFFVAALNIFFMLSMLAIQKRKDTFVLHTLGATPQNIYHIFMCKGLILSCGGAAIGTMIALVTICLQQQFKWVSLGISTSLVQAYPVQGQWEDFVLTTLLIIATSLLAAYYPARSAAKRCHIMRPLKNVLV